MKLVGGPLDGSQIKDRKDTFIWVTPGTPRVFLEPGGNRQLYRRITHGEPFYLFAGHQFHRCEGCQGYVEGECEVCAVHA